MNTSFALIALCAGVLSLGACDKTQTTASAPMVDQPMPSASGVMAGPLTDPSLPSAESAISQSNVSKTDPTPVRTDGTRQPAQDGRTTPMPGQNNDHSAPLGAGRPASAP